MSNLVLHSGIGDWFIQKIYSFFLILDSLVYWLVNVSYQIFRAVTKIELFNMNDGGPMAILTKRIYSILGVVMLFILAYNILNLIINPDGLGKDGDTSLQGIVRNLIISLVMIALLPTAFSYMNKIQDRIISTNVLSNIVFGTGYQSDGDFSTDNAGAGLSLTMFTSFFHPVIDGKVYSYNDCLKSEEDVCALYTERVDDALRNGNIYALTGTSGFFEEDTLLERIGDDMQYYFIISLLAGALAAYLILSFAYDMGIRVVKLGVLQVIAPIPIITRITKPKGGVFDKWFKEISKTYLMVFERLIVIYFSIFTISLICADDGPIDRVFNGDALAGVSNSGFIKLITFVILILGILAFAKEAPKMIEDLFGMKIPEWRIKKKLENNEYAMRGSAMGAAALSKGFGNFVNAWKKGKGVAGALGAGVSGFFRGGHQGLVQSHGLNSFDNWKRTVVMAKGVADANEQQAANDKETSRQRIKDWAWNTYGKSQNAEYINDRTNEYVDANKDKADPYKTGDWKEAHDRIFADPTLTEEQKIANYEKWEQDFRTQTMAAIKTEGAKIAEQEAYDKFKPAIGSGAVYNAKNTAQDFYSFATGGGGKTIHDAMIASMDTATGALKKMKEYTKPMYGVERAEKHYDSANNNPEFNGDLSGLKANRDLERSKAMMKLFDEQLDSRGKAQLEQLTKAIESNPQAFEGTNLKLDELNKMVKDINDNHDKYFDANGNINISDEQITEKFGSLYSTVSGMQTSINNTKETKVTEWATAHMGEKEDKK